MAWRRALTAGAVLVAVGLVVVLQSATGSGTAPRPRYALASPARLPRGTIVIGLPGAGPARPIPAGFLGLGIEYKTFGAYAGSNPRAVNPVLEQLIRNLSPGQAPVLRLGGDTSDWQWWPIHGMPVPPRVYWPLTRRWLAVARAFEQAVHPRLLLGINLEADIPRVARVMARALIGGLGADGSIEALELGNEPELFGYRYWDVGPDGRPVYPLFQREFSRIARALPPGTLAGPATEGTAWLSDWARFIALDPRVGVVTGHLYPLQACLDPTSATAPTLGHLLSPVATRGIVGIAARFVGIAHAQHRPLLVDEINVTPCPDAAVTLRSFGEALWALNVLFELANVGVDGVNIQTTAAATDELFSFAQRHGRWSGLVEPEYYGLLMFARAVPAGSRLLRISDPGRASLHVWATQAADGSIRIVLINTGDSRQVVALRLRGASRPALLERLLAPGAGAGSGVTLAGQGYGRPTTTGALRGASTAAALSPATGRYVVRLPPVSAALLTIP